MSGAARTGRADHHPYSALGGLVVTLISSVRQTCGPRKGVTKHAVHSEGRPIFGTFTAASTAVNEAGFVNYP